MSEAETYRNKAESCTALAETASTAENRDALRRASDAWLRLSQLLETPPLRMLWAARSKST